MRHRLASLLLAVCAVFLVSSGSFALAQPSGRAVRVLALTTESQGVLVAPDRVYVPGATSPLSACTARRCAPVQSVESCEVPRCPGTGFALRLAERIEDVSDFPTDREGFQRAVEALRADPELSSIAPYFGTHPAPPPSPLALLTEERTRDVGWELSASGLGGVVGSNGVAAAGATVGGGFRFSWRPQTDEDELIAMLFGDVLGLDLRARVLQLMPTQASSSLVLTLGIAPALAYGTTHDVFRLPTIYSVVVPELGVTFRDGYAPAWYAAWRLPFGVLVDEHVGLEASADVMIVDDWMPGDDVEAIVTFGLGMFLR